MILLCPSLLSGFPLENAGSSLKELLLWFTLSSAFQFSTLTLTAIRHSLSPSKSDSIRSWIDCALCSVCQWPFRNSEIATTITIIYTYIIPYPWGSRSFCPRSSRLTRFLQLSGWLMQQGLQPVWCECQQRWNSKRMSSARQWNYFDVSSQNSIVSVGLSSAFISSLRLLLNTYISR